MKGNSMEENKPKSNSVKSFNNFLVLALIVGAFYIGSLRAEVKSLKSDVSDSNSDTNRVAPSPSAPQRNPLTFDELNKPTEDDWYKGNKDAEVVLIEYSDLECPFCKKFHSDAQKMVDEYGDRVKWVYRHFPLDSLHPKARKEAEAVECAGKLAGNEGFWKLTDKIFEVTPANNGLDLDTLPDLAEQVGLNRSEFEACLNSGEMADAVDSDYQKGVKDGVRGTPGNILVNLSTKEIKELAGALPYAQLSQEVEAMLK